MKHPLFPSSLEKLLHDTTLEPVAEGESDAAVWRVSGSMNAYLKISMKDAQYPVSLDKQKLDWLSGRIAAPKVLHYAESETHQFLLMSALAGLHPMHDDLAWTGQERILFLANAMQQIHALPIADCPFRVSIAEQVALAHQHLEQGLVREDLLEPSYQGRDLWELFAELEAMQPQAEDWVVTHGDSYPMNIRAHPQSQAFLGFIDVGALAVADRYTDFAPIANAISWHLGETAIPDFFAAYGISPDFEKLRFYQLLNEFY